MSRLDAIQKIRENAQEAIALLDMRHVRAVFEQHPFRSGDPAMDRLCYCGRGFVVPAGENERRNPYFAEPGGDVPVPDNAGHAELARTVHDGVDLRIARKLFERP